MFETLNVDLVSNTVVIGTSLLVIERWHDVSSLEIWKVHTMPLNLTSSNVLVKVNISDVGQSETVSLCFSDTLLLIHNPCQNRRASWS